MTRLRTVLLGYLFLLGCLGPGVNGFAPSTPSSITSASSSSPGQQPGSTALMAKKKRVNGATVTEVKGAPSSASSTTVILKAPAKHSHDVHSHGSSHSANSMMYNHLRAVHMRQIRLQGKHPVLILNADYQPLSYLPLSVCSWKDAIKALWLDRVVVVDHYDTFIRTSRAPLQLPSVVRLKKYINIHQESPALHRRNLYLRDSYQCQYCGKRPPTVDELSLDHVVPRCEGGGMEWENVVTCCTSCNHRKGRRSLQELKEVGLSLMKLPRKPTVHEIMANARKFQPDFVPEPWQPYFVQY